MVLSWGRWLDIKSQQSDFPGGSVDKNLPANERDMGLIPGAGRFPHAKEQQSSCVKTTEPARLEPVLHERRMWLSNISLSSSFVSKRFRVTKVVESLAS